MGPTGWQPRTASAPADDAARKRVAMETYARHEGALRRTARRYSLCADDAEDALQRGLEILLRKAPSEDPRELIRWTQTVVKHEALAVRRERERILAGPAAATHEPGREDWVALIPSSSDGPPERAERSEVVARSREALQALKPQELRALTLLAEGYSYVEIGDITGFSATKINRCLAEGRARFRSLLSRSEDGSRCAELGPLISSYCDGEAAPADAAVIHEHLRACAHCRSTLKTYRAAPTAAKALAPALVVDRSLLDRLHDGVAGLAARLGFGGPSDSALGQWAAAGGGRGAGMAALAKTLAVCAGTVGGAAACVATGVVPAPIAAIGDEQLKPAPIERQLEPAAPPVAAELEPESTPVVEPVPSDQAPDEDSEPPEQAPAPEPPAESGAVEYAPPAPVQAPPAPSSATASSGDPSGEFGP